MLHINKILYPTDFSACAQYALEYAVDLARRYDARLRDEALYRMQTVLAAYEEANIWTRRFYRPTRST